MPGGQVDAFVRSLEQGLEGTRCRRPLPRMTGAALVLLDLQRIFIDPGSPAYLPAWEGFAARTRMLLDTFREAALPVIWTRHVHPPGDPGSTIGHFFGHLLVQEDPLSELEQGWSPGEPERVVDKSRHSAFSSPVLSELLEQLDVEVVVLAGVQTHLCVLATAVEAGTRDVLPVVALDATAAPTAGLHRASLEALSGGLAWAATVEEIARAVKESGP